MGDNKMFNFSQPLTGMIVLKWLPAVSLFTVMLVSSIYTLRLTSVPTAIIVRTLTPLCTAISEYFVFKSSLNFRTWSSLIVILLGASLFLYADPSIYPLPGYLFA